MPLTYQSEKILHGQVISVNGNCFSEAERKTFIGEAESMINGEDANLIFDLENMEHLNSHGINAFIQILRKVNEKGGKVVFVNVPNKVNELLAVIKLNSIFNIENNLEDGIRYLNA